MAKLAALVAYLYQALLAFGLLLAVSHLLSAEHYVAYSLFVSLTQFAAIAMFEWIRFACSRFYPGPDQHSEAAERGVIQFEFLASSALCLLCGMAAPAFGSTLWIGVAGAVAAILQAAGELHLTMLRFRQQFRLFSLLQGMRASVVAAATLAGAFGADFTHVVIGVLAGNLFYCVVAWVLTRRILPFAPRRDGAVMRRHLAYGSVSAGASVASLAAPLGLKAILMQALGTAGAAGPMLALDLLQRPFILIVSAIHAIRYPQLVALFDRGGATEEMRGELGRYYALLAGFSIMGAAAIIALIDMATTFLIASELRASFLRTAPLITLMALLRALTQMLLPTPAHLRRRLSVIGLLAASDAILTCAGALAAAWGWGGSDLAIAAGAAAGAALALAGGLVMLRLLPFEMPWLPIASACTAFAAAWGISAALAGDLWLSTSVSVVAVIVASLLALPRMLHWLAR